MPTFAAPHVWTGTELVADTAVELDHQGVVVALRPAQLTDAWVTGILSPGMINAHTHLELSHVGLVPGGRGLPEWVGALFVRLGEGAPQDAREAAARAASAAMHAAGVAGVIDVSNGGGTGAAIATAGLRGVVQVEAIGWDPDRWRPALAQAGTISPTAGVSLRATAHATVTCAPDLLRAALQAPPSTPIPTLHCDEDPADHALLADAQGPWATMLDAMGRPWRRRRQPARSGVDLLQQLGLLSDRVALVHLVHADADDLDRVAQSHATAVLCPRSNQHIGGALPDIEAIVARDIPIAIGTDSLASCPDLDPLRDAALLHRLCANQAQRWMRGLTAAGARLMASADLGHLRPGARPGLLHFDTPPSSRPLDTLLDGTPWPRRWLA